jgi:hypothetical protein
LTFCDVYAKNKVSFKNKTNMPIQHRKLSPSDLAETIGTSNEYREERNHNPDNRVAAVAGAAIRIARRLETRHGYLNEEATQLNVIGHIDSFARAQEALDNLRDQDASPEELLPYKREVITFNHALKEMIDNNPSLDFNDVLLLVNSMYAGMHSETFAKMELREHQATLERLDASVRSTLNGMRHEIGYEQIIGALQQQGIDIDYAPTTDQAELKGIDMFITLDGVRFSIDIKASRRKTEEKRLTSRRPNRIVQSHISNVDFVSSGAQGGGFRISHETAIRLAPVILEDLRAARDEELAFRRQRSRRQQTV